MWLGVKMLASGLWLCHSLQFAAMLTVFTNLTQYYVYLGKQKRVGTSWERFGPVLCVFIASMLLMVHPTIFLLRDLKIVHPVCASSSGQWALHICSYFGYVCLFYAAMWGTDGFDSVWNMLRGDH
eukprot:gnl/TRDRNA2_/TRDRNA2_36811_c0_seq1.p1 gnl/TRDRNA2_/TRDRNA2_36811_c0~~gnl/TRDRNA2_/TRDRNA2_36811_c0_seq1.p1  ORF type:complete len:125 (+),score=20.89 gnl/TRDRNA2_/TRDRNA2_36811_c0_seq1:283-657(+)